MSSQKVKEIEALLEKLHNEVTHLGKKDPEVVEDAIVDLSEIFSSPLTPEDKDLCINLLFAKNGLNEFCKIVSRDAQFATAKKHSLDLFKNLIEKDDSFMSKHGDDLKKLCLQLYNADGSSKVRCSSLELLCLLLTGSIHHLNLEGFDFGSFVEQLSHEVNSNKGSQVVYQQLYTLGVLTKACPEYTRRHSTLIYKVLRAQLSKKTGRQPDLTAAAGAVRGLCAYLFNFPQGLEDNPRFYSSLYVDIHKLMNPYLGLPKRDVQRAALELIHHHGSKFSEDLLKQHVTLFRWLTKWCQSTNRDDHKVALRAMDTFIVVISNILELEAEEKKTHCIQVFKFLLKEFKDLLEGSRSSSHISLAVKGYGLLAGPCKIFLTSDDVSKMFFKILTISQHGFFQSSEMLENKVANLPSYIESLGIIVSKMDSVSSGMVDNLLQLCIALAENFPFVSHFKMFLVVRAFFTLFASLSDKVEVYSRFLHDFVYHFILHTCSHLPLVDKENTEGGGTIEDNSSSDGTDAAWTSHAGLKGESESYKSYLPLWRSFLSPEAGSITKVSGKPANLLVAISRQMYEEFLECSVEITDKLDLSTFNEENRAKETAEGATSDPLKGLQANTPKDFQVYINICCLMEVVVPLQENVALKDHLSRLLIYYVKRSSLEPLVSTHYGVITLYLRSSGRINFFEQEICPELETAKHLLMGYVLEVLQRVAQYRDHLLASCLSLVLRLPICIVKQILPKLISPLQMSLQLGLSYLPIARICVSVLHLWSEHLDAEETKSLFSDVLPMLLPYLRSQESLSAEEMQTRVIAVKMTLARQRRKVEKKKNYEGKLVENSAMREMQLKILDLLGHLDPNICSSMVTNSPSDVIAWDTRKHVTFAVPFQQVKLDIQLDDLLPHIVDRALNSGDRQTKVAACELLHSVIILMIGTGHQQNELTRMRQPMTALYLRVFQAALSLSCDADNVTRQLFLTLTFQLIHWFTRNKSFEHPDTAALLQVIMEGIVTPNEPSLRDFSAECLKEFLKWSVKQSSSDKKAKVNPNLKSVLKRIIALSVHPSAYKRLGGCLAWNSIYTEMREDTASCDHWILVLLSTFLTCLSFCEMDDPLVGTQNQCQAAVDHIERILRVRKDLFQKPSSARRLPNGMESGTLKELLEEVLMPKVGSPSALVRHAAMELIRKLAPFTQGYRSDRDVVEEHLRKRGSSSLISLVEASLPDSTERGVSKCSEKTLKEMILRIKWLLASLDAYVWTISTGAEGISLDENTKILEEIDYFFDFYSFTKAEKVENEAGCSPSLGLTSSQLGKLDELRCTAIVRLFDFVCVLLNSGRGDILVDRCHLRQKLPKLILICAFSPHKVGFNLKDTEVTLHLPQKLKDILSLMHRTFPREARDLLQNEMDERVKSSAEDLLHKLPSTLSDKISSASEIIFLVDGLEILHCSGWINDYEAVASLPNRMLSWVESAMFSKKDGKLIVRTVNRNNLSLISKCLGLSILLNHNIRKNLLGSISSQDLLQDEDGRLVTKGAHTLNSLGDVILALVVEEPSLCVDHATQMANSGAAREALQLLSFLMKILVKKPELRTRFSANLIKSFLRRWTELEHVCSGEEQKVALISLLMSAIMADKEAVIKTAFKTENDASGVSIVSFFRSFLSDSHLELATKTRALKLLPFLLSDVHAEIMSSKILQSFRLHHIPLKLTEYSVGSLRERELRGIVLELLTALEFTGSLPYLSFIVRLFCSEESHPYDGDLEASLTRLMTYSQTTKQIDILNHLYKLFHEAVLQRVGILEKALIPCLHHSSEVTSIHFFVAKVSDVVENLGRAVVGRSEEQQRIVISKYGAFSFVQVLYSKLPKEKIFAPGGEVSSAFAPTDTTGKELTKEVLKRSVKTAKGELRHDLTQFEIRRKCSCAAYNTLIAVLSNVQDQLKFYNNFLFSEVSAKDEAIFEAQIDTSKEFSFDIEVNFDPTKKLRFASVHRTKTDALATVGEPGGIQPTAHYLASHYLSDSSLKEDLSQYDFSSAVVLSQATHGTLSGNRGASGADGLVMTLVNLDQSDFNTHEVMPSLTAIIRHMVNTKIMTLHKDEAAPTLSDLPAWMAFIRSKLSSPTTKNAVKIFLLRLIINTEYVFGPYANFFADPMLSAITDRTLGSNINYFIVDVMVTMLQWGERGIPQDKNLASETLRLLVSWTPQTRADVFKYNLGLIKLVVEKWKAHLSVPYEGILALLETRGGAKREVEAGIQVSGILLANGIAPFPREDRPSLQRFFSLIMILIGEKASAVYSAAAEVLGMLLKFCTQEDIEEVKKKSIQTLQTLLEKKLGQGLSCTFFIHKHYPSIVGPLINKLLAILPRLYGINRERILQCLLSYSQDLECVFSHLKEQNILDSLTRKEVKTQLVSLELVYAVLHRLSPEEIGYFLPGVSGFESHSVPQCRELMYQTLIWIYDNFRRSSENEEKALAKEAQIILLKGTKDEDALLRQSVRNFWIQRAQALSLTGRISFILTEVYAPEAESAFLLLATHVLLQATHSTSDFLRPIFQHPLTECVFREMKISRGWKAQHASMVPLFADTQEPSGDSSFRSLHSLTQSSDAMDAGDATVRPQGVQATQNYVFSATQNPGVSFGDTYNWVTGDTLDTSLVDKEFKETHAPTQGAASGLLFSEEGDMTRFKRRNLGNLRMKPDEPDSLQKRNTKSNLETQLLRRRFVANQDREKQTVYFARQEEMRRARRQQIEKERKMMREAQVTIYRQYRVGELPDVQIPHKELIAPLQALAERDDWVASHLLQLLFGALIADASSLLNAAEEEEWRNGVFESIRNILAASENCNPHVIRPMLHLALTLDFDLNPEVVSSVCLRSNLEPLGILCLERQHLRQKRDERSKEPARKKHRTDAVDGSRETSLWLHIADLYKNMSMWDDVLGILKSEIGALKEETVAALEAESEKKHFEAYKNYLTALNKEDWDVGPSLQEQQVWEEWFITSAESLGQWEEIEKFVEGRFLAEGETKLRKLSNVWHLPPQSFPLVLRSMVDSKLMKILQGAGEDGGLCEFVNCSRNNSRFRNVLETDLGLQMAVLALNQEKMEEAQSLLRATQVTLLARMVQCSLLSAKSMVEHLNCVQALTDLKDFLSVILSQSKRPTEAEEEAKKLISKWSVVSQSNNCSVRAQFEASYKNLYLHFLKRSFSFDDDFVNKSRSACHFSIIRAALADSNPHVSHRYLSKLERTPRDAVTDCLFNFFRAETSIVRAKLKGEGKLIYLIDAWSKYLKQVSVFLKEHPSASIETQYLMLESSICLQICEAIRDSDNWNPDDKYMQTLHQKFPDVDAHSPASWYKALLLCSYNDVSKIQKLLDRERGILKDSVVSTCKDPFDFVSAFYEDTAEEWTDYLNASEFSRGFVRSVLKGMAGGSKDAHFRFPRLIHLLEQDPSLAKDFVEESKKVPVWMFLLWLSHILIYLDKSPGPALHELIKEMTEKYPHAVIYPFEVSQTAYNFDGKYGAAAKKVCEEINSLLSKLSLVRQFVTAVSLVHLPHTAMKDRIGKMNKILDRTEGSNFLKECYTEFLKPENPLKNTCKEKGSVYYHQDEYLKEVKTVYESKCGSNLSQISKLNIGHLHSLAKDISKCLLLQDERKFDKFPKTLESYSPWLASFNALDHREEIEIPGQYHGLVKPMPEYHTKISSFNNNLLLLKSMRVPIRITIHGSDEKEYKFLIKSGEDLRTDQRIESIFCLLNNIFDSCASPRLSCKPSLVTYAVVPMTTEIGILEWVDDTQPLMDFMTSYLNTTEKKSLETATKSFQKNESWPIAKLMKREECVRKFEVVVNLVPWDMARRGLLKLAVSHEGFFYLRSSFLSSYATLCLSHWVLGIGDRHLFNFLLNLKTGKIVGIDFGHHFETATQFLPVPELVPFRLTNQIRNIMQPLGHQGQFRETMIACLSALKSRKNILFAAVEAFVKEPTEDWMSFVTKVSGSSDISQKFRKFSQERMLEFRKKLCGHNPTEILMSFVARNSCVKGKVEEMKDIVRGKGVSRRWSLKPVAGNDKFSVADQVDVLIDIATDPNILGRAWPGWKPYI